LHLRARYTATVRDDGERIAAEPPLGKDIDRDEFQLHGLLDFRWAAAPHPDAHLFQPQPIDNNSSFS
jgi:hypothetical protein